MSDFAALLALAERFVTAVERIAESRPRLHDVEARQIAAFLVAIDAAWPGETWSVKDLAAKLPTPTDAWCRVSDAVLDVVEDLDTTKNRRRFGLWLDRHGDRIDSASGLVLRRNGMKHGVSLWFVAEGG